MPKPTEKTFSFFEAARSGNTDLIGSLLEQGTDVNARDEDGKTALSHAAFHGKLEAVILLLEHSALVDLPDRFGATPLFWAVCAAHTHVVKLLTDHGADINARDHQGRSPFLRAASGVSRIAHVDILQHFLQSGPDMDQADHHGVTALMNAAGGGSSEIARLLIKAGANVHLKSRHGDTALIRACQAFQKDRPEMVQWLIDHGADIHVRDQCNASLLHLAAKNGHTGTARVLLNAGLDINENSGIILRSACDQGDMDTVRLLVERGADVNLADDDGKTALMIAVSRRHNEVAFLLILHGADVNAVTKERSWGMDRTVLMFALGTEDPFIYERSRPPRIHLDLIKHLLEKGADPNYKSKAGITPLKLARQTKNSKLIGLLKKFGAVEEHLLTLGRHLR